MNKERQQILDMLENGKITAEEAGQLLDRIGEGAPPPGGGDARESGAPGPVVERAADREAPASPKYLRVLVDSSDGDRVNIRVPLALVRTGIRLGAMMPEHAREKLEDRGIDLSQLSGLEGEELLQALRELTVDVDSSDGDTVRIFCE
ncbi:MAG: hypothetical protein GF330_06435 [Candidatus Eisenbacteria bacterium]|nr:hypothetical protein [Candidatus Eisenbacteria bacterium]